MLRSKHSRILKSKERRILKSNLLTQDLIKWNWRLNWNQRLLCSSSLRNTVVKCWFFLRKCFTFKIQRAIYCLTSILRHTFKQVYNFYGAGGMQAVPLRARRLSTVSLMIEAQQIYDVTPSSIHAWCSHCAFYTNMFHA